MSQLWTIVDQAGTVICPAFETPSVGSHPKDNGWDWDSETQSAVRIDVIPDPGLQDFNGSVWQVNLPEMRARLWIAAKAARDRAEWSGCATPLGAGRHRPRQPAQDRRVGDDGADRAERRTAVFA